MAEVRLQGVSKRFGDIAAVREHHHDHSRRRLHGAARPTGAGKTTTLRLFAGLEPPDAGGVSIAGRDAPPDTPAQRDVAMVFQQYSLYPHLTVRENLAFPLRSPLRRCRARRSSARVARVAEMLRIAHKLDSKATQLSGGEMQRVSIGRALVRRPAIYLMDGRSPRSTPSCAPSSGSSSSTSRRDLGATMLYVTHDQTEAMTMATHVGVLDRRPAGAVRLAARDLRAPRQRLCRDPPRPAAH